MNANLWKIHDLEKVGDDPDLLAQFAVVGAFLKSADLEGGESVERDGRHGDIVLREMRDLELLLSENKIRKGRDTHEMAILLDGVSGAGAGFYRCPPSSLFEIKAGCRIYAQGTKIYVCRPADF
jgi:hypothetical protein